MNLRLFFFIILAATSTTLSAGSALLTKMAQETDVRKQIDLFFSVFPDPATTYPTLTQVDDTVALIFEHTLGLPQTLLRPLQRFYAYLKQRAVNEYLATVMVQEGKKQMSLLTALTNATEQLQIAHLHKDTEMIPTWTNRITTLTTQKQQELTKLGSTIVERCTQTTEWQNHLKIFITNSFSYEYQLLGNINQDEIKMFTYLPQFETAYYSGMYAQLRNDSEYVRVFLVMSNILRQRVKAQCPEWRELTDLELYDEMEAFTKTDFYIFAQKFETISSQSVTLPLQNFSLHGFSVAPGYADYLTCTQGTGAAPIVTATLGMDPLFSIKNNVPALTSLGSFLLKEGTITPQKGAPYAGLVRRENFDKLFEENIDGRGYMPSPLFMELLSFNAINLLNQNNSYLFNPTNLTDTMQRLNQLKTTKSVNISAFPNVIFYQPEDQLFLEDINTLTTEVIIPPSGGAAQPADCGIADFFNGDYDSEIDNSLSHAAKVFEDVAEVGLVAFFAPYLLPALVPVMFTSNQVSNSLNRGIEAAANAIINSVDKLYAIAVQAAQDTLRTVDAVSRDIGDMTVDFATGHFKEGFAQTSDILDDTLTGVEAVGSDAAQAATTLVNGVAQVATAVVSIGASVLATVVATVAQDPQLGTDLTGTINSVADTVIYAIQDTDDMLIQLTSDVVVLSTEAQHLIAKVVVATVEAFTTGDFKNLGNTIANSTTQFLQDTVQAILGMVSLGGSALSTALKNIMVSVAYLTAALTDIIEVVASDSMAFGAFLVGGPEAAAAERNSVITEMNQHRRLISAIVGTVLMIAVTVATLGAAGPLAAGLMIALTAGMMIPTIIGANQQDMDATAELESQEAFLSSFTSYVQQCGPAQAALQQNLLSETSLRLQEQAYNADRGLVYYQNYVNNSLSTTQAVQAYQASSFSNILTTPDITSYPPNGLLPADPGYSYGLQTNRMDLNPSQGFRVYNAQRGTFAQEIATLPAPLVTSEQTTSSFSAPSSALTQHFITQKDLCNFTTNSKTVTVRWRVIYESQGDFYIGIYLNKNHLDTAFLNLLHSNFENIAQNASAYDEKTFNDAWLPLKTFNAYLYNFDHLAQAFVCYRNTDTQNIPALGIYQHLGKGFISAKNQPAQNAWFKRGTWYIMKATATDTQITVSFSQEDNPAIRWSSSAPLQSLTQKDTIPYDALMKKLQYSPQQAYTGSFGIITSGAAVEYQLLTPQQSVTQTSQRQTSNLSVASSIQNAESSINGLTPPTSELQREQQWIQALEKNIHPTFGNWDLTAFSDLTVAQGTYVYGTQSTKLSSKTILTDFVVSLANPQPASAIPLIGTNLLNSPAQLGKAITPNTQYMVSLVTGNCYNTQGTFEITYPDALAAYLQQNPKLPSQLTSALAQATQAYYTAEVGGFVFKNVTVTGVIAALKKDIFIYSCPSFTQYLSGLDYLVFVNIPEGGTPGTTQPLNPLEPTNTINAALSLITGTVFNLVTGNTPTPLQQLPSSAWKNITLVPSGVTYPSTLETYQPFLNEKTVALLQQQINNYTSTQKAVQQALIQAQLNPPKPITPPVPAVPPAPIPSLANLQSLFGSSTGASTGDGGGFSFSG
jgi:uncharacterized protein YlbG (UPF0298 family)